MDQQGLLSSIYSHDTIYMPPAEKGVPAVEIGIGCSWAKCRFCDFAKDKFCIHSSDRINHDLQILGMYYPEAERLFFLGENVFCLPADKLMDIIDMAKRYMPNLRTFAMYSRIDDIERKSDDDLALLRFHGVDTLHIGVESGCDRVLSMMDKGITAQQTVQQTQRLEKIGIFYHVTIVPGLGGKRLSNLHALHTAQMLSMMRPISVWCLKLHLYEGTLLMQDYEQGKFDPLDPIDVLREERMMLQHINAHTFFMDTTVLDKYTLQGMLPEKKQEILETMDLLLEREG